MIHKPGDLPIRECFLILRGVGIGNDLGNACAGMEAVELSLPMWFSLYCIYLNRPIQGGFFVCRRRFANRVQD